METSVLQVLMRGLISDYAEQVGPCPNPWAPGTLLETVLQSRIEQLLPACKSEVTEFYSSFLCLF